MPCNACSDSIATPFRACFLGIAQLSHDTLQNWVSHGYVCLKENDHGVGGVLDWLREDHDMDLSQR